MSNRNDQGPVTNLPHYPDSDFALDYPLERPATCGQCGWSGTLKESDISHISTKLGFYVHSCPKCEHTIKSLNFPTFEEVRDEAERGNPNAIKALPEYLRINAMHAAMEATEVKSSAAFPELTSREPSVFVWDNEDASEEFHKWVVVRVAVIGQEICREAAYYEGSSRFLAIQGLLAEKYGVAFKELVPTDRSKMYLYGDDLSAPQSIGNPRTATADEAPWVIPS